MTPEQEFAAQEQIERLGEERRAAARAEFRATGQRSQTPKNVMRRAKTLERAKARKAAFEHEMTKTNKIMAEWNAAKLSEVQDTDRATRDADRGDQG